MELIRLHILVNCMELRWRQPCSDPVAPCMKIEKSKLMKSQIKEVVQLKTDRSFTSIQMVHTHTHTMSRYIVSNGVGMSTSDKVFDLVWNSFGNKELFDSDKSSSFEERHENSFIKGKACQIPNGGGKMDTRSENKMMSIQDCMTLTRSVQ